MDKKLLSTHMIAMMTNYAVVDDINSIINAFLFFQA